jgi:hypothetical protein
MSGGLNFSFLPIRSFANGTRSTPSRSEHVGHAGVEALLETISSKFFEQRLQTYSYNGMRTVSFRASDAL